MTLGETHRKLNDYCCFTKCNECLLNRPDIDWTITIDGKHCPWFSRSPKKDLDLAVTLISHCVDEQNEPHVENDSVKNPYWDRITVIANRQRSKGISEYGRGIEDDTVDINVRLDRIEEELIDALMYLEHLRDGISKIKEVVG